MAGAYLRYDPALNIPAVSYPLLAPSGSAGAPSYSFSADPTTGMYYTANQLDFAVGGQLLMSLTSQGALTIGKVGGTQTSTIFGNGLSLASGAGLNFPIHRENSTSELTLSGGSTGSVGARLQLFGETFGGGLSSVFVLTDGIGTQFRGNSDGTLTLGNSNTTTFLINSIIGTNAAGVGTLTNLPTGKSGNPTGYIQISLNGTTAYIPYW